MLTLIGIIAMLLLIAFFSGVEAAFTSANKLSIELKKKQGRTSGIILSYFMEHSSRLVGTTLVGFSICLILFSLLTGQILQSFSNRLITEQNIPASWVNAIRIIAEILFASFIILVVGEFIPRAIFRAGSNFWLTVSARLLNLFHELFYPLASMLARLSYFTLDILFGIRIDKRKEPFYLADLDHVFQHSTEEDSNGQDRNTELFENALSLPNVKVRQCLVPRKEIEGVDINASIEEVRKKFVQTQLSKLVVYDNNIDHVIGYIHQLDLFKQPGFVKDVLLPIPAVPESMSATELISKFTRERKSVAWVVDEFGGTSGIVTMEDLLEEIFGEIKDEYDVEEFEEKKLSEDEYILSGRLELDYLIEKYNLEFPENESETLSGYIINAHQRIPRIKERIILGDYEFEMLNVSDTRIEMVRLRVLK
ncbi:MAG TPA: hemolysin family protein [Chitinophagaceae bacterium]